VGDSRAKSDLVPRVVLRPKAREDLVEIWEYIADESTLDRADDYLRRLAHTLQYLAAHPHMGRSRPELDERVRSFPFESHLIFHVPLERQPENGVELVRVIHASRDLESTWRDVEGQ